MGCGYYRNVTIERQQRHAIATAPGRVVDIAVYRPCAAPANFYAFVPIHLRVDSFQRGFSFSARSRDREETHLRAIVSCLLPFRESYRFSLFLFPRRWYPRRRHRQRGKENRQFARNIEWKRIIRIDGVVTDFDGTVLYLINGHR